MPAPIVPERDRAAEDSPNPNARIWIGNLPLRVNERAFIDYVSRYGEVEDLFLPRDHGGKSKGYAFVEFISPEFAVTAVTPDSMANYSTVVE